MGSQTAPSHLTLGGIERLKLRLHIFHSRISPKGAEVDHI